MFLRNTENSDALGTTGGTAVTQLPEHTHTTNVTINGKLYSASRDGDIGFNTDSDLLNCSLFAPKENEKENVFYSASATESTSVAINWETESNTTKDGSRATSSAAITGTYFPITLDVDKDYDTKSTAAANANVELIAGNTLPDNCPPFTYVKMYKRTA